MDDLFAISKAELRQAIRTKILRFEPDLLPEVTDRMVANALYFCKGYSKCLDSIAQQPINKDEVISLLVDEAVTAVIEKIHEEH